MEIITGLLYLFIGLLIGGLAVLVVDTRTLGRRLKAALDAKRRSQAELSELTAKLAALENPSQPPSQATDPAGQAQEKRSERHHVQENKSTTDAELAAMQDNLTRVSNHVEVLLADKHALQVQSAAAEAKAKTLHDQLDVVRRDNSEFQEKNELLRHQLGAAEVEIRYLRRDLRDAQAGFLTDNGPEELSGEVVEHDGLVEPEADELPLVDELFRPTESPSERLPPAPEPYALDTGSADPAELKINHEASQDKPLKISIEADSQVQEVRGIGPVFSRRLKAAGIHSVADLATQTPEQLSDIVGLKASQNNRPASWIAQAQAVIGGFNDAGSRSAADDPQPSKELSQNG